MKPALTVRQLAKLLNVHERTIYRMAASAELPGFRVSGSWRFLEEDIEGWIRFQKSELIVDVKPATPDVNAPT